MRFQKGWKGGPGRPPGPIKQTLILKDALLLAAQAAGGGGKDGLVTYLTQQAQTNPAAFLPLLGRVIPLQMSSEGPGKITVEVVRRFDPLPVIDVSAAPQRGGNGHRRGDA